MNNGSFHIARQLFSSDVWLTKPAAWKIIWIYILGRVNHTSTRGMKRGEGFFNFSKELPQIGVDISIDQVKKFLKYAKSSTMVSTSKSTRGIRIIVNNYNRFQSSGYYRSTTKSTSEAPSEHHRSTTICNNVIMNIREGEDRKNKHLEFVYLTTSEYDSLKASWGESNLKHYIERMNDYIGSKGVKYKSHYHALKAWYRKDHPGEVEDNRPGYLKRDL